MTKVGRLGNVAADDGRAERAVTVRRRARTYALLADVFHAEPTAEMLAALGDPEVVRAFAVLGAAFPEELRRLAKTLGKNRLAEELGCEYARLFVGPGKHVGPYESLHRDDHRPQHWGPATAEVKRLIEHHGLKYRPEFNGMPDHIAAEFQFMAMLGDAEADAIESSQEEKAAHAREIQRFFRSEHIARWVPAFCDKVIEHARLDFYRDFARIAKTLVEQEIGTDSS